MIVIKNNKVKRILGILIPLVLIPAAAVCGSLLFDEQKHIFVSLAVAFLSLILFITGFERKVTGTRRLVLVAVMTAISVLGRFIPFFKLIYGVLSGIAFSLIMDVWTVLWYSAGFDAELYLASVTAAIPHTILYAVSNFIFLLWLSKPFGDKLERIKIKYGV